MKRFALPLILLAIGLILLVTGSRLGGPVYRTTPDKHAALIAHDTVPAIEQNGDTAVYRFETTHKLFADPVYSVLGLLLIAGGVVLAVRRRAPTVDLDSYAANPAKYWKCPSCGLMNPDMLSHCSKCGTVRP